MRLDIHFRGSNKGLSSRVDVHFGKRADDVLLATIKSSVVVSARVFATSVAKAEEVSLVAVVAVRGVLSAEFAVNHQVGVLSAFDALWQKSKRASGALCASAVQGVNVDGGCVFGFGQAGRVSHDLAVWWESNLPLFRDVVLKYEQGVNTSGSAMLAWGETLKERQGVSLWYDSGVKLALARAVCWERMDTVRGRLSGWYQVANPSAITFDAVWGDGLDIRLKSCIVWEQAKPVHYKPYQVPKWEKAKQPIYRGKTDLHFLCRCDDKVYKKGVLGLNRKVDLHFGRVECIPELRREWWYVMNELKVSRLDNGEILNVLNGDLSTDKSSWCWSYQLNVPYTELDKLQSDKPLILKIEINGFVHLMLLENKSRSRVFGRDSYTLKGRSVSALLDSPSSPSRAYLQENEYTSVQLCQAEIERSAYPDLALNWQLIDELGWVVPVESLSYSGLTPIAVIKQIAESGGGFVFSEPDSQSICIKHCYPKAFWQDVSAYDVVLPASIVTEQAVDYTIYPDYNGITLTNDKSGLTGQVKRTGTSGDVPMQTENNDLFSGADVMGSFGKMMLAKAGLVETHQFTLPLVQDVGHCKPADILAFDGQWWGVVDSVSVSFAYDKVVQSVSVERVKR